METTRDELAACLDRLLEPGRFRDYGPNGLQVEGRRRVRRLASGVTASLDFIDAAVAAGADTLLVHHGLFWRGQDGRVTGWMRKRLGALLAHDLNLFAYHLPLDAHPVLGNNVQLGTRLGLVAESTFGEQDLGVLGAPLAAGAPATAHDWRTHAEQVLGRAPTLVPGDGRPVRRVAWCTGGAQGYFEAAIAAGADLFLTGEISEPQAHIARESGVVFLACGHHATERFGAPAVGAEVARQLGIEHQFIEIANPA